MSSASFSTASTNANDANFIVWGSALSGALDTVGFTKTADTGQINWGTFSGGTYTANSSNGYEIRAFSDALQGAYPVFAKIEYGTGTGLSSPGIYITVGTGSDGAGTITGVIYARTQMGYSGAGAAGPYPSRVTGDTNRVAFALFHSWVSYNLVFSLERTHASDGTDTNVGVLIWKYNMTAASCTSGMYPFSGGGTTYSAWFCILPPSGTGVYGSDIAIYPVRTWSPFETAPSVNLFEFQNTDLTPASAMTMTAWWGSSISVYTLAYLSRTGINYVAGANLMIRDD